MFLMFYFGYIFDVLCFMLYVICYMLYVICYMLYVIYIFLIFVLGKPLKLLVYYPPENCYFLLFFYFDLF